MENVTDRNAATVGLMIVSILAEEDPELYKRLENQAVQMIIQDLKVNSQ